MRRSLLAPVLTCLLAPWAAGCGSDAADRAGLPPTADERLAVWATLPEGTSVPVALGFGRALSDSVVVALLERHGLRPYAVYLTAADVAGSHRRERSRASIELLGEAREQTIAQLRTSMCAQKGRARALLAETGGGADPIPLYREVLSRFLLIQKTLPELETGAPLVYGVERDRAPAPVAGGRPRTPGSRDRGAGPGRGECEHGPTGGERDGIVRRRHSAGRGARPLT